VDRRRKVWQSAEADWVHCLLRVERLQPMAGGEF
jgi:hypothetical protein